MVSTGCLVTDCLFQGPACDGVSIASGSGGNKVIRNKFNGTAYGIYFGGDSTSNTLLADNTFINVGSFESDVYDKTTGDVKGHVKFIDLPVISVQKSADGFVVKNNTFYATTGNVLIAAQEGNTAHGYPSDMGNFNITENTVLAYDENVLMSTVVLCQIESNIGTLNPSGNIRIFDNTLNGAKVATYWSNEWFEDGKGLSSDVFIGAAEKVKTTFLIKSITPTKIEVVIQDAYGKPVYDSITDSKTGVTTVLTNIIVINNGVETIVQPDENGNFEIIAPVGTVSMNFAGNDKLAEFFLEITTSYEFMNNTSIKIVSVDKEKLVGKLVDAYDQPLAGKIVSYTIGTTTSGNITTGSDGTFVIDNPNGLIKLDFAKNGTYESSSNQVNYTNIPKTDSVFTVASSISLTAIETAAGEAGKTITLYIKDANGNVLANKNVKVVIGSTVNNVVSGNDGKISVLTKLSAAGNYPVSIVFLGDDNYNAAFAKSNIKVVKKSTTITPKKTSYKFKAVAKNKYITATLKTNNKYLKAGKKVTITIKGKTYSAKTGANGAIKLNLKNLKKKGTYKVTIIYKGTAKYSAVKKTNKIFVKKVLKTKVTAPKITTTPKTSTKYTVTLKDENGKILKKQKVTVNINGKKYTKKTNSKGQVTIKVKFSKIKSYKVKATYKGSKLYKKSSASGKISVQKFTTKITAPNMDAFPNTSKDYTVTLTGGGKPIAKQSLKIALNGQTYTKTTNNNGQVTIQTKFANENSYKVTVTYAGSTIYKSANAAGTIKVSRVQTQLVGYDRTFSKDSNDSYIITLKDSTGNALVNQKIIYNINNTDYSQFTDNMGQIKVNISSLTVGSYEFKASYQQSNQYKSSSSNSLITILNKTGITFIDKDLPGDEIQARLNQADINVEFLGNTYNDVSLTINKAFNITFMPNTIFNGKAKSVVLTVSVSNYRISDLTINPNEGEGIVILNSNNVTLENNTISNTLNQANLKKYNLGELLIPGNGIRLSNVSEVHILKNDIKSFGNAIIMENSNGIKINNNTLSLSNYGITYGEGVKNTNVSNNLITKNIGLYVMDVPEGPLGYGIYLYKSAVNVTVSHNNISDNYMGISVDSNYSTGIVITSNLICDNALDGIRFNAGYDLAENAVEPDVNDNAIYRNAKGPSMMILGELSANPDGIYHYGLYNDTKRLQLGTNWYGKNARVTWDYDNNVTGYGTMCPRIATTYISVKEIEVVSPGTYSISFYKNDEVDDKLPIFEMYATLNDNVEIRFNVVNGVGLFSFDDSSFDSESNEIKVSIGPLKDEKRTFEALLSKTLNAGEIPA